MKFDQIYEALIGDMSVQRALELEQLWRKNLKDPKDFSLIQIALAKLAGQVALQNAALKPFAEYFRDDLTPIGGGTIVSPSFAIQVYKDAKAAYLDLPTTEAKTENEQA